MVCHIPLEVQGTLLATGIMTQQHAIFGKGSKYFITISADNRVRLWDVDSNNERRCFVEKHHLSHSYTCSTWGQTNRDDLGLFAVGSSDGVVIIWDLTRGVVARTIGKPNESSIPSDIAFSKDMTTLFVCYLSSSHIDEYNVVDGQLKQTHKGLKKGAARLALSPSSQSMAVARYASSHPLLPSIDNLTFFPISLSLLYIYITVVP